MVEENKILIICVENWEQNFLCWNVVVTVELGMEAMKIQPHVLH